MFPRKLRSVSDPLGRGTGAERAEPDEALRRGGDGGVGAGGQDTGLVTAGDAEVAGGT